MNGAEKHFGHRLVAAFGDPGRAEIAATHVQTDSQIFRFAFQRFVQHAGIGARQLVCIVAALSNLAALIV
ncbi:hypothetical protein D3C85_1653060 [compost metagenome]